MKKITFLLTCCMIHAAMYAQTDWHITGNSGTNSGTNFIGTTDKTAFNIRTTNKVRMTINSSGNVGIGTTNPQYKLDIHSADEAISLQGLSSTASNSVYMTFRNSAGTRVGYVGDGSLGNNDIFLDSDLGDVALITNGLRVLSATASGNVGIGTTTPAYKFSVTAAPGIRTPVAYIENTAENIASDGLHIKAGSNNMGGAYFINFLRPDGTQIGRIEQINATTVFYGQASDKRLKNIIGASQKGLSDLMKIKIYDYTFKTDPQKQVLTGFMAQELYEIFQQAVSKPRNDNEPAEKNPWMVDYGRVTPLIIKSVQEQQQMIDELKKSNDELEKQNESFQKQIDELKALLISQNSEKLIAAKQTPAGH